MRSCFSILAALACSSCTTMPPEGSVPPSEGGVSDFTFLDDGSLVVLTGDMRLLRSHDDGGSWEQVYSFCPSSFLDCDISVRGLTPGANESIWATWTDYGDPPGGGLAISRDGGKTFSMIANLPYGLIENPGSDPFVISYDGQLWQEDMEPSLGPVSFQRLGVPNPDGAVYGGPSVLCMDSFFVSGADGRRASRIWRSSDQGNTWESDVESFFYPPHLACGAGQHLWAVMDRTVLYFDVPSKTWNGVGNLEMCGAHPCANWIAANASALYVAGWDSEGKSYIAEVFPFVGPVPDINISRLPLPDPTEVGFPSYRLKASPQGELYASSAGLYRFNRDAWAWTRVWL